MTVFDDVVLPGKLFKRTVHHKKKTSDQTSALRTELEGRLRMKVSEEERSRPFGKTTVNIYCICFGTEHFTIGMISH